MKVLVCHRSDQPRVLQKVVQWYKPHNFYTHTLPCHNIDNLLHRGKRALLALLNEEPTQVSLKLHSHLEWS